MVLELLGETLVLEGENLDREDPRVLSPVEADRGDRDPGRHLRHAEDRVEVELPAHRHADDGLCRMGGDRPGEGGREPRNADEDPRGRVPDQVSEEVRRAVGDATTISYSPPNSARIEPAFLPISASLLEPRMTSTSTAIA